MDESYSGISGCMQIISDCIYNENVMFESLFNDDYREALNETSYDPVFKTCMFLAELFRKFKIKVSVLIDDFLSKLDNKKSKELKALSEQLPKDLKKDEDSVKYILDKFSHFGGEDNMNCTYLDNKKINMIFDINELTSDKSGRYEFEKSLNPFKAKEQKQNNTFYNILSKDCIYNIEKNPELFIKNLYNPCYIIDSTYKDIREIKKKLISDIDKLIKELESKSKELVGISKKDNQFEIKDYKKLQVYIIKALSKYMKMAVDTYKLYVFSSKYIITKEKNREIDPSLTLESVEYDIDYDFGIL